MSGRLLRIHQSRLFLEKPSPEVGINIESQMGRNINMCVTELSKIEAWVDQAALHSVENHLSNGLQTSFVQVHQDTISVLRMKTWVSSPHL